jgi:S-adenosylmethionine:tRNA ribosyltransferase-isomerase
MRVDAFQYELPLELVAQRPAEQRELARLMYLPPREGAPEDRRVAELPELLPAGALVVVNDTRVIPARLLGRKRDTGGRVEVLLLRRLGACELEVAPGDVRCTDVWTALGKASKPLKFGTDLEVPRRRTAGPRMSAPTRRAPAPETGGPHIEGDGAGFEHPLGRTMDAPPSLMVRLLGRTEDDGLLEVALWTPSGEPIDAALRSCGHVPLPPYIKREAEPSDADRYQTVYARHDGAVAAPTAGLHLTDAVLARLALRGCDIATVTLHVGLGTFQPVTADDLDSHPMHAERYVVSQSTADAIAKARHRGAPVVAVGTTTVRALETAADPERPGCVLAARGETRLLVQPGYAWRITDALLTNFHLPRSSLLALVCALGGTKRVLEAYEVAVRERYRFFSYGDAMLLWRRG